MLNIKYLAQSAFVSGLYLISKIILHLTKSPACLETGRVQVVIEAVEAGDGGAVHVEPPVAGEVLLVVESPWTGRLCAKLLTSSHLPTHLRGTAG